MRRASRDAEEWRALIDNIDRDVAKSLVDSNEEIGDSFRDLQEPILELSDSLIQAEELQKQFTASMFQTFSDLFMSIGEGTDDFVDSLRNAFKRLLADRATLELFKLLSGLGGSLTSSSQGQGLWGAVGSFLTSSFGGGKAGGGPLEQGKWYIAGERGREPIWGGGTGAFAMGYPGAGSGVTINNHIDARGASAELVNRLPGILRENNEQVIKAAESRIVSKLKARAYG
jgi:hypothetical protein